MSGPASPPRRPPARGNYGWFLGVAALLLITYVSVNTLRSNHLGARGVSANRPLPAFAAPLATGSLVGDVDVATRARQGNAGRHPACSLRGPEIVNVCELEEQGPVALAFFVTGGGGCSGLLDGFERVRGEFRGVRFAAVAIRGSRSAARSDVSKHHWGFPVAYDHDGVLANLYGVSVCPQATFAYVGGVVAGSTVGKISDAELRRRLRTIVAGSRARGWKQPAA